MSVSINQSRTTVTSKSSNIKAFHHGYLNKHVNALKGYQTRFFVVNAEDGRLDYYLTKDAFQRNQKDYRGSIALAGTEVAPREEDSVSFNVFAANGQVFQLKADTAKDRQKWVDAIRFCVQKHNEATIDPLAVTRQDSVRGGLGSGTGKKKKKMSQVNTTLLLPTQEILNTREAINNAEQALQQMSEIIANYPIKSLNNNNAAATSSPSANVAEGSKKNQSAPPAGVTDVDMTYYESMLSIKAFSVTCLQDLKLCFEAVQSEYFKNRAS